MKVLRYITIGTTALIASSVLLLACIKNQQTDEFLKETDKFIETHQTTAKETETTTSTVIKETRKYIYNKKKELKQNDDLDTTTTTAIDNNSDFDNSYNSFPLDYSNSLDNEFTYEEMVEETPIIVEETTSEIEEIQQEELNYYSLTPEDLLQSGVIYWGDWRFTWYSENVLPGGGLNIPGRWSDGNFVRDENGYICCASEDLAFGSVLSTPWGDAKVYDCGCDYGTIDMYVSW